MVPFPAPVMSRLWVESSVMQSSSSSPWAFTIWSLLLPVSTSHRDTEESMCPVTTCLRVGLYRAQDRPAVLGLSDPGPPSSSVSHSPPLPPLVLARFEQSQIIFAGHQQMRLRLCRTTRSHEQEGEVSMFWDSTQLQTRELEVDSFEAVMWRDVPDPQLLIQSRKKSSSDFYRRYRSSSFLTHSISGVAKDLLHGLVDGNIQYSGAVTQQCGYRTSGDKPAPEPDRSVRTSCDHQLQRCTVVKAFNTLKRERERETTEYMLFPFSFSSLSLVIVQHFKPGKTKPW